MEQMLQLHKLVFASVATYDAPILLFVLWLGCKEYALLTVGERGKWKENNVIATEPRRELLVMCFTLYTNFNTLTLDNLHKFKTYLFVHMFFHHPDQLPHIL